MSRVSVPELKTLMDKQVQVQLNAKRTVTGILRGYDAFMNLVLEDANEVYTASKQEQTQPIGMVVIRGNSVSSMRVVGSV